MCTLVLCVLGQRIQILQKVKNESHSLNLYGFARSEMYVNSRENYEAKGGVISLYPKPNMGFSP